MNVNFNGFGENAATFIADETITEAGVPVKMKDNGTVAKCNASENFCGCLLYTSDAADERSSVELGGCRINKKKKQTKQRVQAHTDVMTKS